MRSLTFSSRRVHRRRRFFVAVAVIALGIVVAGLVVGLQGDKEGAGKPTPSASPVAFVPTVSSVSGSSKAAPRSAVNAESSRIVTMFNDFYQRAFVSKSSWGDGTFPELATLFAADARTAFTRDVASLTIGEGRLDLARVDPVTQNLALTIYFDAKGAARLAVAVVDFGARAAAAQPKSAPVNIEQHGVFYLEKQGSSWVVTAYDTSGSQVSQTPTPSASPSA